MEGSPALTLSSPKAHLAFGFRSSSSSSSAFCLRRAVLTEFRSRIFRYRVVCSSRRSPRLVPAVVTAEASELAVDSSAPSTTDFAAKTDKSGRFCSPRAAREFALLVSYAACLEGTDPVRLFDRRVNARRLSGYDFDKAILLEYDHMSFGGAPINAGTEEEAEELLQRNEKESAIEAEVLSAPPKLVYNRFVLRTTRDILEAVVDRWDHHVSIISKIIPQSWKDRSSIL
ncbi:antitermination NusB domain-containing protein isoform X2 [Wolffia australiana]